MKKKNNQKYKYQKFESVSEILLRSLSDGCEPFLVETASTVQIVRKEMAKPRKLFYKLRPNKKVCGDVFIFVLIHGWVS